MNGKGALTLTGHLGDVMKESVQAALSWIRSRSKELGLSDDLFQNSEIHVHVPAGAIPKDGPSAGITMATALVSALTKTAVRKEVAMTGEITLRGKVLPIGGLKEKILAAIRAGIKTIIIPAQNEKDLVDIPKIILKKVKIITAKEVEEVLKIALESDPFSAPASIKPSLQKKKLSAGKVLVTSRKGVSV
jgi:ATP-dependent Lon protease